MTIVARIVEHLPDIPFYCLVTGRAVRKPLVTRLIEAVIIGLASGALSLYITVQILQRDVDTNKASISELKRHSDVEDKTIRTELKEQRVEIMHRLERIEDCMHKLGCVK